MKKPCNHVVGFSKENRGQPVFKTEIAQQARILRMRASSVLNNALRDNSSPEVLQRAHEYLDKIEQKDNLEIVHLDSVIAVKYCPVCGKKNKRSLK